MTENCVPGNQRGQSGVTAIPSSGSGSAFINCLLWLHRNPGKTDHKNERVWRSNLNSNICCSFQQDVNKKTHGSIWSLLPSPSTHEAAFALYPMQDSDQGNPSCPWQQWPHRSSSQCKLWVCACTPLLWWCRCECSSLLRIIFHPSWLAVGVNSERSDVINRWFRGGLVNWEWKQWKKQEGRREFFPQERDLHSKIRDIWPRCGFISRDTSSTAWASHQLENTACIPGSGCPSDSSLCSPTATSALLLFSMHRRSASQRYACPHITVQLCPWIHSRSGLSYWLLFSCIISSKQSHPCCWGKGKQNELSLWRWKTEQDSPLSYENAQRLWPAEIRVMVCLHSAQSHAQGCQCPGEFTNSYSSLDKAVSARHTLWAAASVVAGSGVCASVSN